MREYSDSNGLSGMPWLAMTGDGEVDLAQEMQIIAERYSKEEELLSAVASGDEAKAIAVYTAYGQLMQAAEQKAAPTSADSLRDFKNSVLVTNTLFRKAIEGNYVHPIYIHASSSWFGHAIEQAASAEELIEIIKQMVQVYCELVRKFSMAAYSQTVRKILLFIDMNLSAPISTRDIAQALYLTPNYLSTCFSQEVGTSISDYLLHRRIDLARQLLRSSRLSIQEVAEHSGIEDASYFAKQFRRITGMTPLQYRKLK